MPPLWPSHSGKRVPIYEMAEWHLKAALAKLRLEEVRLSRMLAGLDKAGLRDFNKQMECLQPTFTAAEALARTRYWLGLLLEEQQARDAIRWPELHS